jgi:hypothetical protein
MLQLIVVPDPRHPLAIGRRAVGRGHVAARVINPIPDRDHDPIPDRVIHRVRRARRHPDDDP